MKKTVTVDKTRIYRGTVGVAPGTVALGAVDPAFQAAVQALAEFRAAIDPYVTNPATTFQGLLDVKYCLELCVDTSCDGCPDPAITSPTVNTTGVGSGDEVAIWWPSQWMDMVNGAWATVRTGLQTLDPGFQWPITPNGKPDLGSVIATIANQLDTVLPEAQKFVPQTSPVWSWLLVALGLAAAGGVIYAVVKHARKGRSRQLVPA